MHFLVLLALIAAAAAASSCPKFNPVENFRFSDFGNGIWYEVARYPSPAEEGSACGHSEYIPQGDEVKIKNYFVRKNKPAVIEGVAELAPDAGQTGKVLFKLPYGRHGALIQYVANVLDIEYDKYLILYYCRFDGASNSQREFAWILSRTQVLPDDAKTDVDKFVQDSEFLDSSKFFWPSFSEEDCKIEA